MKIITELSNKITTHMSSCMEEALEEGTVLTGMIESTLLGDIFYKRTY